MLRQYACAIKDTRRAQLVRQRDGQTAVFWALCPRRLLKNGILQGRLHSEMQRQAQTAQADGARCIVFDTPLLVESGRWRGLLGRILVVDCSEHTQVERVVLRDGLSTVDVQRIVASQASRTARLRVADVVLFNDGISREHLTEKVGEIAAEFGL